MYPGVPEPAPITPRPHAPASLPEIAPSAAPVAPQGALAAAVDSAFAEPGGSKRNTKAIVIVHDGRVIAERYAAGYGVDTPMLSHSIAKSVINAMVGVMVREHALAVADPAPVPAWRNAHDAHAAITIDNLLRMNGGMGYDEGGGASAATHIWYAERNTAAASAQAPLKSAPGAQWGYSSRSYVLLSRILADKLGDPQAIHDFAQRELFDPLGMHSVSLEYDAVGTPSGAHAMLATPRDWARFGLLYLNDGVVGGRRILPEGWVKYSTTPTGETGYGAGFWLNTTDAEIGPWHMPWGIPGAPADAYMARGYLGQYIVVVPSAKLVIVRMGVSHARNSEIASVGRLVRETIATLPAP